MNRLNAYKQKSFESAWQNLLVRRLNINLDLDLKPFWS
jgi:hypothetical protein